MAKVVCMCQELCSLILEESWRCETREVAMHIMSGTQATNSHPQTSSPLLRQMTINEELFLVGLFLEEMWWCQTVPVCSEYASLKNPWTIWLYWSPVREKNDISCLWECHTVTKKKRIHSPPISESLSSGPCCSPRHTLPQCWFLKGLDKNLHKSTSHWFLVY